MLKDLDGNNYVQFGMYYLKQDKDGILYVRNADRGWDKLMAAPKTLTK